MPKPSSHILELAKRGAQHRIQELKAELAALEEVLGRLRFGSAVSPAIPVPVEPSVRQRRPNWSADGRKAASQRMKKYWAARKKAAAKKPAVKAVKTAPVKAAHVKTAPAKAASTKQASAGKRSAGKTSAEKTPATKAVAEKA